MDEIERRRVEVRVKKRRVRRESDVRTRVEVKKRKRRVGVG